MNNVTLKQLRAFVMVADKASFVSAAKSLHLSQPALSQTVRQLEEQVGNSLFQRTTRSVRLTPLGMSFLPHVRHLLRQFDAVIGDVKEVAARKKGRVTIACLPSVASRLMPRVVATNERLYPGIRVVIRDMNMRGVIASVAAGEVDLGIGGAVPDDGGLESVMLARDYVHALVPITSPLARRRTLRWSDLAGEPFVAMTPDNGLRELIDHAAEMQGVKLNIVAEVSNLGTLNGMLEEGIGVSALPGLVLPRNDQAFIRHRLLTEPKVQRTIRMFWRGSVGLSPAAQALVTSLGRCIEGDATVIAMPHVEWHAAAISALAAQPEQRVTES
jgi:LysR family transcriptional regulator, carnitine catabolism transcriptional activator